MKYVAWAFHQNEDVGDELSEEEFLQAKSDRALILKNIEAEEIFRAVLDNYAELETSLIQIGQEYMLTGHLGHVRAMSQRLLLDRRYANLLSTCRLYLHFADSTSALENEEHREIFRRQIRHEYDSSLGYRVMEALRNYVQHRAFPLEQISYNESTVGDVKDRVGEIRIIPGMTLSRLREDEKFKRTIFKEIEALSKPPDLRPWTRQYIEGLRRSHAVLIPLISSGLDAAVARHKKACVRFADKLPIEGLIVRYEKRDNDNRTIEQLAFSHEMLARLSTIKSDNKLRYPISHIFISNACGLEGDATATTAN